MKKKIYMLVCILTGTALLTGCSSRAASNSVAKGTEYVTDSASSVSATDQTASTAASAASYSSDEIVEPAIASTASTIATEIPSMEDDSLNIVFIGDSQFDNARDTGTSIAELVGNETNSNVYNLGIGGTTASVKRDQRYTSDADWADPNLLGIVKALQGKVSPEIMSNYAAYNVFPNIDTSKVDYYVIEYGMNDYLMGTQIYDDSDPNNICTYVIALQLAINWLSELSPDAEIVLCSPAYALFYNSSGVYIGDGNTVDKGAGTLSDYASACRNTASQSHVLYLDTYFGENFDLDGYTTDTYLSDGIHFTERGRRVYAAALSHIINQDQGTDTSEDTCLQIDDF